MTARAARIGLWLAAAFVFVVLGGWMLLPLFVSSEFVRTAIERELTDITGQPIQVSGRVDVDLFPSPVARLYDLHVPHQGNGSKDTPGDFLAVDSVEVAIPISSLLAREPAFSQFRLVRPVMRFVLAGDGRADLGPLGGRLGRAIARMQASAEAEGEDTAKSTRDDATWQSAKLGTVTIENGTVEFIDTSQETPEKITGVNGFVSWPRVSDRLSASLNGIWRGTAFEQEIDIDDALHFMAGEITDMRLSFASDTLTYAFDGRMGMGSAPFAEGEVTLQTPSIRQALDWLQLDIRPGGVVGNVALNGTIKGDAKKIRFENLQLTLQESSGMGVLEFAFKENAKPSMTATLDFAQMDIPSFLAAFTGFPSKPGEFDNPVSQTIIDQLDVDLRLSAAVAKAGPLEFSDIAAVTQIRNGAAIIEMPDATAYGGRLQAYLKIARDEAGLNAAVKLSGENIDSAAVADVLSVGGLFPRGVASGSLDVTAPLETWGDLTRRATGTVKIGITNGSIDGLNFARLGGGDNGDSFFRLQDNARSGEVFSTLSIDALVEDGVLIVDNGMIEYPAGTVQLNGVIPYGTASLALTTVAQPKTAEGEEPAAPKQHFVGGSWSNPYATPVMVP